MRYITIPLPVQVVVGDSPIKVTFIDFLNQSIWTDKRWRDEWAKSYVDMSPLRLPLIPGSVQGVTDEDWEKLKDATKAASVHPTLSVIVMPFFHAVTLSSTEKPGE